MIKKIKIIDLLNKIANGEEEAPKIIRKGNFNFIFNNYSCIDWYYLEEETEKKWLDFMTLGLNDEVEILDEEDEFEDIEEIIYPDFNEDFEYELQDKNIEEIYDVINQLTRNQKKIIERLNNEKEY